MEISRILDDYRQHTILSEKHQGNFRGRVWKEKALLHETEGTSVKNTLDELKKFVDEKLEGAARAAGRTPSNFGDSLPNSETSELSPKFTQDRRHGADQATANVAQPDGLVGDVVAGSAGRKR